MKNVQASRPRAKRTTLFGSKEALVIYKNVLDLARKRRIAHIFQNLDHQGRCVFVICNTWRIEIQGQSVRCFKTDRLGQWERLRKIPIEYHYATHIRTTNNFNLLSIKFESGGEQLASSFLQTAISACIWEFEVEIDRLPRFAKGKLISLLYNTLHKKHFSNQSKFGGHAFNGYFWSKIVDRDLYYWMRSGFGVANKPLGAYLYLHADAEIVKSACRQHPNLTPFIFCLKRSEIRALLNERSSSWRKTAIFKKAFGGSGALWSAFKKLSVQQVKVAYASYSGCVKHLFTVEQLALLQKPAEKIPVGIDLFILEKVANCIEDQLQANSISKSQAKRLIVMIRNALYKAWKIDKQPGLLDTKNKIGNMLDWLRHDGFAAGYPQKNNTLDHLLQRSAQWHRDAAERARQQHDRLMKSCWVCPISNGKPFEIDGFAFTPLVSGEALYRETVDLNHCVFDFIGECLDSSMLVYAVQSKTDPKDRTTLGIEFDFCSREYTEFQNLGFENRVSPSAQNMRACNKVLALLNQRKKIEEDQLLCQAA